MISQELLDILACPICKGRLSDRGREHVLVCAQCRLAFPVGEYEGRFVPILLVEEAKALADAPDSTQTA